MDGELSLIEAMGRARPGHQGRIRALLQSSPRRAHALIRAGIRRGTLAPSTSLEEQSLIVSMMMNRASIRGALRQLDAEGLVKRRQRVGTSVVESILQLPLLQMLPIKGWTVEVAGDQLEIERLERLEILIDSQMQARLGTGANRVIMQEDVVLHEGEPIAIIVGYHPIETMDENLDLPFVDVDTRVRMRTLRGARIETSVEAVVCDERTARTLHVPVGTALLVREMLVRDVRGTPVMLSYGHYRGDRVAFCAGDDAVRGMRPPTR